LTWLLAVVVPLFALARTKSFKVIPHSLKSISGMLACGSGFSLLPW
jgi:hypothetical protein